MREKAIVFLVSACVFSAVFAAKKPHPLTPTGLQVVENRGSSVTLQWFAPHAGVPFGYVVDKSGSEIQTNSQAPNFELTDLSPCTEYRLRVRVDKKGKAPFSEPLRVKTHGPIPGQMAKPTVATGVGPSAIVSFDRLAPVPSCANWINKVMLKRADGTTAAIGLTTGTSYVFDNLEKNTAYQVTVTTLDTRSGLEGVQSDGEVVQTTGVDYALAMPLNLTVNKVEDLRAYFSAASVVNATGYEVVAEDLEHEPIVATVETLHNFTLQLQNCKAYFVRMRAFKSLPETKAYGPYTPLLQLHSGTANPPNVNWIALNSYDGEQMQAKLSELPDVQCGMYVFELKLFSEDSEEPIKTVESKETTYVFLGLRASTLYKVSAVIVEKVSGKRSATPYMSSRIETSKHVEEKAPAPKDVKAIGPARIKWVYPASNVKAVAFEITAESEGSFTTRYVEAKQPYQYVFDHLEACQQYTIRVRAICERKDAPIYGALSEPLEMEIAPEKRSAVTDVTLSAKTDTSMLVSITDLNERSCGRVAYAVEVEEVVSGLIKKVTTSTTELVISDLKTGGYYRAKVRPFYPTRKAYDKAKETPIVRLELPGIGLPSTPGNLTVAKSSMESVTMKWIPALLNGADLTTHQLIYKDKNGQISVTDSAEIFDLKPCSTYTVQVRGKTATMLGDVSDARQVTTGRSPDYAVITKVSMVPLSDSEVRVFVTGKVTGCDVAYQAAILEAEDQTKVAAMIESDKKVFEVADLKPEKSYVALVRVVAGTVTSADVKSEPVTMPEKDGKPKRKKGKVVRMKGELRSPSGRALQFVPEMSDPLSAQFAEVEAAYCGNVAEGLKMSQASLDMQDCRAEAIVEGSVLVEAAVDVVEPIGTTLTDNDIVGAINEFEHPTTKAPRQKWGALASNAEINSYKPMLLLAVPLFANLLV